jgi:3D (Asp-Asp-Asp) domain-containing protein
MPRKKDKYPKAESAGAAAIAAASTETNPAGMSCSDGWFVTGYYTPGEDEFHGSAIDIDVEGYGSDHFPGDFLKHVRIEGWGLTRHGWYLGWDRRWVKGNSPLNAQGKPLQTGSLAVDRRVIPLGTSMRIPNLAPPWDTQLFVADDAGGGIEGKHVDVYCGPGSPAHSETLRITANNRRVCFG